MHISPAYLLAVADLHKMRQVTPALYCKLLVRLTIVRPSLVSLP